MTIDQTPNRHPRREESRKLAQIGEEELVLSMRERLERDLCAPGAPTCTYASHPLVILLAVFGSLTEQRRNKELCFTTPTG